jgi:hypothetical protein
MRPKGARGARVEVERQFEPNRLARDCQVRAYEEALPVVCRSRTTGGTVDQTGVGLAETGPASQQGGVAA